MSVKTEVQWGFIAHYTDGHDPDGPVDYGRWATEESARGYVKAANESENALYRNEDGTLDEHHVTFRVTKRTVTKTDWEVVE